MCCLELNFISGFFSSSGFLTFLQTLNKALQTFLLKAVEIMMFGEISAEDSKDQNGKVM